MARQSLYFFPYLARSSGRLLKANSFSNILFSPTYVSSTLSARKEHLDFIEVFLTAMTHNSITWCLWHLSASAFFFAFFFLELEPYIEFAWRGRSGLSEWHEYKREGFLDLGDSCFEWLAYQIVEFVETTVLSSNHCCDVCAFNHGHSSNCRNWHHHVHIQVTFSDQKNFGPKLA